MKYPHELLKPYNPPAPTVASRAIRSSRRDRGWSIKELATMLDIDYVLLSQIESARIEPSQQLIEKLAEIFHWTINEDE